ncbi:helix-turn-helix domain-containing protein [Catenovulum sp. 2E275]|uniref:helix-turn-helix domain-containing protein n=1 Tax=Catenovulum sp. 2E275 TaxID=2980497 RepID=UPI0021D37547|nr:helix-turn-helix domain-containing protein [Catenovulum sp. 2E275]MCU4674292.1 helix-turn-helix domain-containing protein [Catenovulum sp. 2E275]
MGNLTNTTAEPVELIRPKRMNKVGRVLYYLYQGGTLNRFEAGTKLHDTCLNSTISELKKKLGIIIDSHFEVITGYQGQKTKVKRYSLTRTPHNLDTALNKLVEVYHYKLVLPRSKPELVPK